MARIDYKLMYEQYPIFWWIILILRIGIVCMCIYFLIQMKKENNKDKQDGV